MVVPAVTHAHALTQGTYTHIVSSVLPRGGSQAGITLAGSLVKLQLEGLRQRSIATAAAAGTNSALEEFYSKTRYSSSWKRCDKMITGMKKRMHT